MAGLHAGLAEMPIVDHDDRLALGLEAAIEGADGGVVTEARR